MKQECKREIYCTYEKKITAKQSNMADIHTYHKGWRIYNDHTFCE